MSKRRQRERGNSIIEFTLVGIPLIFLLISIFEIARGMWIYHTIEYAVTEGTRYAAVHGVNCTVAAGNSCSVAISDVAALIQYAGVGLDPNQLTLTFTDNAGSQGPFTLQQCLRMSGSGNIWPRGTAGANVPGMNVTVSGSYPFSSAVAMFWPGAGQGVVFPTFNLPATATERIDF